MSDEITTTSAGLIGGVHICERCGKKLHWQDELPKCWCESLLERVTKIEVALDHPGASPSGEYFPFQPKAWQDALHNKWTLIPEQANPLFSGEPVTHIEAGPIRGKTDEVLFVDEARAKQEPAQPEIDWEKVAETVLARHGMTLQDHTIYVGGKLIEDLQCGVAEYLRQVKEGGR